MTLTLIQVRRMANIIIICNLLSARNFNPHTYRTQSLWKWKCICAEMLHVCVRQLNANSHNTVFCFSIRSVSTLFYGSAHWLAAIWPISYFFICTSSCMCATITTTTTITTNHRHHHHDCRYSLHFKTLTLFNACFHLWLKWTFYQMRVNDANVNAKENGYRVSQSTSPMWDRLP